MMWNLPEPKNDEEREFFERIEVELDNRWHELIETRPDLVQTPEQADSVRLTFEFAFQAGALWTLLKSLSGPVAPSE